MSTFENYLQYDDNGEYSVKQLKIMDKISISTESQNKINSIDKNINLLIVAEVFCPDCRAIIPFIQKFSELNNKIKVKYTNREEIGDLLQSKTGTRKIPTIFYNDTKELKPLLVEFPKVVNEAFNFDIENYNNIKYDFRTGKFNNEIEKELVDIIISL